MTWTRRRPPLARGTARIAPATRAQLVVAPMAADSHEADEPALGDVSEAAAGGEVTEGGGGQQVGHELVEGLGQGGEDSDLIAVQRGLGGAGLLAG